MSIRVLNVAEKPSVAREASKVLSRGGARFKRSGQGNTGCWEFPFTVRGTQCTMVFTSVAGHLMSTDFQEPYNKWRSCTPIELYEKPIRRYVPRDKKAMEKNLISESRKAQWLILWLDCDREGEHICFEVMEVCQGANRRLQVMRAQFSTLLERDLRRALQTLREPNRQEAEAVDARQEIDLRSGASFTRFLTLSLQHKFDWSSNLGPTDTERPVLSYGPCQFPTLGFIVKRQWEIYAHIPEEFWYIHVVYRDDARRQMCEFEWERKRIFDRFTAELLFEPCRSAGNNNSSSGGGGGGSEGKGDPGGDHGGDHGGSAAPLAHVVSVQEKPVYRWPPHPLSTIEFAKKASSLLRIGSQEAMKIAEDLYQAGFISYPRTETDIFSPEFDLQAIVAEQTSHPAWGAYAQRLLDPSQGLWRSPPGGRNDDKAHPPIHPTKFTTGESGWDTKKKRVYEYVVRHFLACCSERAVASESVIRIDLAGEFFSTKGVSIKARNWLDVYPYSNWHQASLPDLKMGDTFAPHEVSLRSGQTRPPEKLKETDLIAKMEQHGIGTDATMAQHIDTTLKRGYAVREEQTMQFQPTPLGEALVYAYKEMGLDVLWQPFLRADTERQVSDIASGRVTKGSVVEDAIFKTKAQFMKALPQLAVLERSIGHFFTPNGNGNSGHFSSGGANGRNAAAGEVVRQHCPMCAQSVLLESTTSGGGGRPGFVVKCSQNGISCNHKVHFPSATTTATVLPERCPRCPQEAGVFLLDLKFRRSGLPPGCSTELRRQCLYCSRDIRELFEECGMNFNLGTSGGHRSGGGGGGNGGSNPPSASFPQARSNDNGPQGFSRPNPPSMGGYRAGPSAPSRGYQGGGTKRRGNFEGSRPAAARTRYGNSNNQGDDSHVFASATGQTFSLQNRPSSYQSSSRQGGSNTCFKCGGTGHWAANCPNKRQR